MDNSKVLPGYYRFQYVEGGCMYVLKNPKVNCYDHTDGLLSQYSIDNGKTWVGAVGRPAEGFFPLYSCNYFRKLKGKPR